MALATSKDDLDLRGIATDAISSVAEAVGKEVFGVRGVITALLLTVALINPIC